MFVQYLGVELDSMQEGRAALHIDVQPHHRNSGGIVHGGVLSALVDTVAGAAAFSALPKGQRVVTTDLHVTCLRNVREGRIDAIAEVVHMGSRFATAKVEIRAGDALLATGSVSFMVVVPA